MRFRVCGPGLNNSQYSGSFQGVQGSDRAIRNDRESSRKEDWGLNASWVYMCIKVKRILTYSVCIYIYIYVFMYIYIYVLKCRYVYVAPMFLAY